ncbi:MAG: hypothetical protein DI598_21020 [Pseudopedobacter saltans]|uniref:Uncharacterized protein n=1 Tax=Pseudopedobacter saltans TaxID=151895 RepID=A0A2W5G420_9SPHI|nr:MAG: hypothetical protein DI598_21020 [Pseudopedobacter saltans]
MALDKDILGKALSNKANEYNDKDITDINAARLAFWTGIADVVISHFKTNGVVNVNVNVTTTGTATAQSGSGSGSGKIS